MKAIIIVFGVVAFLISVSMITVAERDPIEINCSYSEYGWYPHKTMFIAGDGIKYIFKGNGLVEIRDQSYDLVGAYGLSISGTIAGDNYIVGENEFGWTWELHNRTVMEDGMEWNGTDFVNVTYRYTEYTISGSNNNDNFTWIQNYSFTPHKDTKITQQLTNNFRDIENAKIWYINPLLGNTQVMFNNIIYNISIDNLNLNGNFNDAIRKVTFIGSHTFDYNDLIESGFDLVGIRISNGSIVNRPNMRLLALGFTNGNSLFAKGTSIILDPASKGFKSPTATGQFYNNWTNPANAFTSNNSYATETVNEIPADDNLQDYYNFNFGVPADANVTGIVVRVEAQSSPITTPDFKNYADLGVQLSWDTGTSWTAVKTNRWLESAADSSNDFGNATDDWGHAWNVTNDELKNGRFRLRINITGYSGSDFDPGVDHIQVNVYYLIPPAVITFIDPTPANGGITGSTFTVNITSDQILTDVNLSSNHTGSFVNYSMTEINSTIWHLNLTGKYDGLNNGTGFSFEVFGDTGVNVSTTGRRNVTVVSQEPLVNLNSPGNATASPEHWRLLNWTVLDPEDDYMDVFVYGGRNLSTITNNLIWRNLSRLNETVTLNWSAVPIDPDNYSNNIYALYHLDDNPDFDENDTYVFDHSNNGRNGSSGNGSNAHSNINGRIMGSFLFDGTGDNIALGNKSAFWDMCENNQCSVSAWAYNNGSGATAFVIAKDSTVFPDLFFRLQTVTTTFGFLVGVGNGTTCSNTAAGWSLNTWHHLAATWNSTHICNYIDGELADCDVCEIEVNTTAWQNPSGNILPRIGAGGLAGTTAEWEGWIDEVGVWNRSLTAQEVRDIYYLSNGTWFWNVTAYDSPNGINSTTYQFDAGAVPDTCTYSAGNWNVDCSDNCYITTSYDLDNNNLTLSGSGTFTLNASLNNYNRITVFNPCRFQINEGWSVT